MKKELFLGLLGAAALSLSVAARPIPVASIGEAEFNTLGEALQVANQYPGSTIEILSDATYGTTLLTFEDVTINLNGYTINRTDTTARWFVGGIEEPEAVGGEAREVLPKVIINGGNGSCIQDAEEAGGDISTPLITAQYAQIEINDVTMLNRMFNDDASAFCLRDGADAVLNNCDLTCNCGIKIFREVGTAPSSLVVNGGTITSEATEDAPWKGSAVFAELACQYDVSIELNDVTITSTNTAALTLSPKSHAVIRNCVLEGYTGIYTKAGDLNIEGTTIKATGAYVEEPVTGNDINTAYVADVFDGSGILIDSDNVYGEPLTISLKDSTIESAQGYAVREIGGKDGSGETLVDFSAEGSEMGEVALLS